MPKLKVFDDSVEICGLAIKTLNSALKSIDKNSELARHYLKAVEIIDFDPDHWYPQQKYLDILELVRNDLGNVALHKIGKMIPHDVAFPPNIKNLEEAYISIDVAYNMNHRGGNIGNYRYTKISDTGGKMICNNPYPAEFNKGLLEGVAENYLPEGKMFKIKYDSHYSLSESSANSSCFLIEWEK